MDDDYELCHNYLIREMLEVAGRGDVKRCEALLGRGVDINCEDGNGNQSLHMAAKGGHAEMCRFLVDRGAEITVPGTGGFTALHYAVAYGHKATCLVLIEKGLDIEAGDNSGNKPLHKATDLSIAKLLLESGAEVDSRNDSGESPLHLCAAGEGNEDVMVQISLELIEHGADVDAFADGRETPLLAAATSGSEKMCKLLIEKGASVHLDSHGNEPLHRAAEYGHIKVCRLLLDPEWGIDLPGFKGRTPMAYAARNDHLEVCRFFVEKGASSSYVPPKPASDYLTPFQSAVKHGRVAVLRFFIEECGEDLGQKAQDGQTLVQLAGGRPEVLALLLSMKTELEVNDALSGLDPDGDRSAVRRSGGMSPL